MCYTTHHTAVTVYLLGFWTSGWSCWGCWGRPASCDGLQDYTTPAEIINIWSYNTKYTQYHVFPIWMQFRPITTNPGGWNLMHAASKTHHTNDWIFSNCCSHYCITGNLTSTLQKVLSTIFRIQKLTDIHECQVSLWLAREIKYAPPTKTTQPFLLWIFAKNGCGFESGISRW